MLFYIGEEDIYKREGRKVGGKNEKERDLKHLASGRNLKTHYSNVKYTITHIVKISSRKKE